MPDTLWNPDTKVQAPVVVLEFDTFEPDLLFSEMGRLFEILDSLLTKLQWLAREDSEQYIYGYAQVDVLQLSVDSPLKMTLGMSRVPKDAFRAFVMLCDMLLFYRQEKSARQAMAAERWEEVRAKRIKNVKALIGMATAARKHKEVSPRAIDSLLEDTLRIEDLHIHLTRVEAKGKDDDGERL